MPSQPAVPSSIAVSRCVTPTMQSTVPRIVLLFLVLALTQRYCDAQDSSSSPFPAPCCAPPPPVLAPLLSAPRPIASLDSSNSTRYRYIVVLGPNLSPTNLSAVILSILPSNASVHRLLIGPPPLPSFGSSPTAAFNAFSAYLTAAQLAVVRTSPLVAYVEQDGLLSLDLDVDLVDMELVDGRSGEVSIGQVGDSNPLYSWGLDRIVSIEAYNDLSTTLASGARFAHPFPPFHVTSSVCSEQASPATRRRIRQHRRRTWHRSDRLHDRHRMPYHTSGAER